MSVCKKCGREIKWVKLKTGKWHPCDCRIPYKEDPKGGYIIINAEGEVVMGEFDMMSDRNGWLSHFATCPFADEFRRKKGGAK